MTRTTLTTAGAILVAGTVVGLVAVAWLGSSGGSAVQTRGLTVAPSTKTPLAPPRGAIVLAREVGVRAVALAVEGGAGPRLTATVLGSDGAAESGLAVSFRAGGATVRARACGPGCYRARAPAAVGRVRVLLPRGSASFTVPAAPRSAAAIVRRASRVIRRLRSLVYTESLRSDPANGILTTWRILAPHRLSYRIRGGASAVVIGERRWDQEHPGDPWKRGQQIPALDVPQPAWGGLAVDSHVLAQGRVDGRPVWIVSFANPTIPAWFTAWIDRGTYRTLQLRMTAGSHFMFHRYLAFDRPLRIVPPR